jgi:RNA binding exosome subunit
MNERIRELAEQAGIGFWGNRIIIFDFSADSEEVIQKFAELVVNECAQFVEDKFDFIGDEIIVKERMLEHFGVKS